MIDSLGICSKNAIDIEILFLQLALLNLCALEFCKSFIIPLIRKNISNKSHMCLYCTNRIKLPQAAQRMPHLFVFGRWSGNPGLPG